MERTAEPVNPFADEFAVEPEEQDLPTPKASLLNLRNRFEEDKDKVEEAIPKPQPRFLIPRRPVPARRELCPPLSELVKVLREPDSQPEAPPRYDHAPQTPRKNPPGLRPKSPESPFVGPPPVSAFRATSYRMFRTHQNAEDIAEVEVLMAQARKHDEIGKKIKASLQRIQETGSSLQAAVGPAYNDTQNLKITNNNVDKLLTAINKIQTPLDGKADEERIIRDGPASVGLQAYLASLKRVESKYKEVSKTPMRMNQEISRELGQLLNYGAKKLQELFETLLKEDSKQLEPLQFVSKGKPFPGLPQGMISQLAELDAFISTTQRGNERYKNVTTTVQSYADMRGRYLQGTLATLAAASTSTARRQNSEEIYRPGTCAIGTYAQGIGSILLTEWNDIITIFSRTDCGKAFEMTAAKALSDFAKTVRDINSHVKSHITTDCFLAFEIIGIANDLAFDMDQKTGFLKQQIVEAVKPIRDTAKLSLSEMLDDVRRRISTLVYLPTDGAAIPLTTEIMNRLQALVTYPAPAASVMTSLGDGNWASAGGPSGSSTSLPTMKSFDVGPDSNALIAHYIFDTIDALFSNLESKARSSLKQKALTGVLLANNVAVVERMIRASHLQPIVAAESHTPKNRIDFWRKKGTSAYLESWREPCAALMETQYTNRGGSNRPPSGSSGAESAAIVKALSSKEKDAIKEKFKVFNVLFESLSAKHREIAPSMEREVRSGLTRDIQAMIEPLYGRFWERYHEVDKGKGKYVRYDKASLSAQLASLG